RLVEFFIHCESNGISSRFSVYLIRLAEYISSKRVYLDKASISSAAGCILFRNDDILAKSEIYSRFCADDIRCPASMIYTPFGVIWVQIHTEKRKISFLSSFYNKKIQPVGWIFSLWG
ncbi:MAG: hypothetical protein IJY24_05250, partial [Clostridia bacterium]|nr:hypothetical protein [Clostridia bacterium]